MIFCRHLIFIYSFLLLHLNQYLIITFHINDFISNFPWHNNMKKKSGTLVFFFIYSSAVQLSSGEKKKELALKCTRRNKETYMCSFIHCSVSSFHTSSHQYSGQSKRNVVTFFQLSRKVCVLENSFNRHST
jgi:hypothetical protein